MKRLLLLICLLLLTQIVTAQDVISPELETQIENLESTAESIRDLDTLVEVELNFPTREELRDYLIGILEEEYPPEVAAHDLLFYRAFDFMPADTDLSELLLDLYSDQIAGFYDTETDEMNVILFSGEQPDDSLPFLEQIIFVHEYVHALQDQHFDLDDTLGDEAIADSPDRYLAALSLIEGDATATMNTFAVQVTQENPVLAFSLLGQSMQAGALSMPQGVPDIIVSELLFPYEGGQEFVLALYTEAGDWSLVNAAYDDLPQSTEQIYHPEKYLAGELPVDVTLPDNSAELGDGWELTHDRTFGEFYLRQYLDLQLPRADVNTAASGWGGDRYHIYYNESSDQIAWVLAIEWDSKDDMTEFSAAFTEFGDLRFESTSLDGCWVTDAETLCMQSSDRTVISYAPDVETAQMLLLAGL